MSIIVTWLHAVLNDFIIRSNPQLRDRRMEHRQPPAIAAH
jgi:hypothetical protein